jgi:hypothetical protein
MNNLKCLVSGFSGELSVRMESYETMCQSAFSVLKILKSNDVKEKSDFIMVREFFYSSVEFVCGSVFENIRNFDFDSSCLNSVKMARRTSDIEIMEVLKECVEADVSSRVEILKKLDRVGASIANAILSFLFPDDFYFKHRFVTDCLNEIKKSKLFDFELKTDDEIMLSLIDDLGYSNRSRLSATLFNLFPIIKAIKHPDLKKDKHGDVDFTTKFHFALFNGEKIHSQFSTET